MPACSRWKTALSVESRPESLQCKGTFKSSKEWTCDDRNIREANNIARAKNAQIDAKDRPIAKLIDPNTNQTYQLLPDTTGDLYQMSAHELRELLASMGLTQAGSHQVMQDRVKDFLGILTH
jgi:hypothetical protein